VSVPILFITMPSGIRMVVINEFPNAEFEEIINTKIIINNLVLFFLTTKSFLIFLSIIFIFILSILDKRTQKRRRLVIKNISKIRILI